MHVLATQLLRWTNHYQLLRQLDHQEAPAVVTVIPLEWWLQWDERMQDEVKILYDGGAALEFHCILTGRSLVSGYSNALF